MKFKKGSVEMAKIRISDTLELESDQFQVWFNIVKITEKGQGAGQERREPQGYCPTLEDALHSLAKRQIGRSEAITLEQLGRDIQAVHEDIKEICKVLRMEVKQLREVNV